MDTSIRAFFSLFSFTDASLEDIAYGWVCLFGAGLTLINIPVNFLLGLPYWLNLILIFTSGVYILLFLTWRLWGQHPRPLFLLIVTLSMLASGWFGNGGLQGAVPIYFMSIFILSPLVLKRRALALFSVLALLLLGSLLVLENRHPEWIHPYASRTHWHMDMYAALSTVGLALMGCVWRVQRAYRCEREKAVAASQIKSQFLSRMSHELRTPLNVIIGLTQQSIKKEGQLSAERKHLYLERIEHSSIHLLALVNELLDLSRIESGRVELKLENKDLCEIMRSVVSQLEVQADNKHLRLELNLPETPVAFTTDSSRLKQILLNLGGNAIKFTPSGEVRMGLSPHSEGWLITVDDTGPGIPASQQQTIFEPFSRLNQSGDIEGTGLGLAITHSLCEALGYSLSIQTRSTGGTRFQLLLPGTLNQNHFTSETEY